MKDSISPAARSPHRAITFYGYAVKKDGKYLGFIPKPDKFGKFYRKQFFRRPEFPVVCGRRFISEGEYGYLGEVVKVKLTMEEGAK